MPLRERRLPDGTILRVHVHGTEKPHRHKFQTNKERTRRACVKCGEKQVKVKGRWQAEGEHGTE